MPHAPLPRKLIRRLKRAAPKIHGAFERLPIQDHRSHPENPHLNPPPQKAWGKRVRRLSVKRLEKKVKEIVIKRMHGLDPESVIRIVRARVEKHNKSYPRANYYLIPPFAHSIGENLIAMRLSLAANVTEIIRDPTIEQDTRTARGKRFFDSLKKKHEVDEDGLREEMYNVAERSNIMPSNLLLLGIRKGKFVFMPLVDLF